MLVYVSSIQMNISKKVSFYSFFFTLLFPGFAIAGKNEILKIVNDSPRPIFTASENRIISYTYSPDVIFRIFSSPTFHTHIQLAGDEGVVEPPNTGDPAQWLIQGGPKNIYVKPLKDDIETSLTIITDKRAYQFQLISKKGGQFTQKVSFNYPDDQPELKSSNEDLSLTSIHEQLHLESRGIVGIDPKEIYFDFEINGEAPFKPLIVYSDSKFTYLKMPRVKNHPAVFLLDDSGKPSLVNYKVSGDVIVIDGVAKSALLKLGSDEVKIMQKKSDKNNGKAEIAG
jgi:type IV secretion system protein VirB9